MSTDKVLIKDTKITKDVDSSKKQKKDIRGFLKAAFTGAVVAGAMRYLAVSTAGFVGLSTASSIALTSIAVGFGLTMLGMISEYRKLSKETESKTALSTLLSSKSLKKHGTKMIFNTVSAAVGALSFIGVDYLLDNTASGLWLKDSALELFSSIWDNDTSQAVPQTTQPIETSKIEKEAIITPVIEETLDILDVEPLLVSPLEELESIFSQQEGIGSEALKTLDNAQDGDKRAIKDLAVYLFNGVNNLPADMQHGFEGVDQNRELAIKLYQQSADMGYTPAQNDLDYIEKRGWMPEEAAKVEAVKPNLDNTIEIAVNEELTDNVNGIAGDLGILINAMNNQELSPQAQRIYDGLLLKQDWALESAGTGMLNGLYGLPKLSDDIAVSLIQEAADNGYKKAQIDMAYFQYHNSHGVPLNKEQSLETIRSLGQGWAGSENILNPKSDRIAVCNIFQDNSGADCSIKHSEIKPDQYIEIKNSDGTLNVFYLDGNASSQKTDQFISERIKDSMTLNLNKL